LSSNSDDPTGPVTVWMSHDAGNSWRQVESGPGEYAMYRNGVVYDTTDVGSLDTFSASADDGATWTVLEPSPDPLVQDGWRVDSTVPDYRSQQWWYRELSRADSIPVLEHSQDNGRTWSVVGPIGASAGGALTLATTPMAPTGLCAGRVSPQARTVVLLASGDGGQSWRTGTMPPALQHAQGETTLNVAMGDAGECYEGFHYGLGQDPASGNSYFGFV
jgi:hypothetical protein